MISMNSMTPIQRSRAHLDQKLCELYTVQEASRREVEAARYHRLAHFRRFTKIEPNRVTRLRQNVVDPFSEIEATLARGMAKRSRPVDARSETVAAVFQEIPGHYEKFMNFHRAVREGAKVLAEKCSRALTAVERKKVEQKEKEEKERMRLLRSNNYDEYVKLLRQTKNKRLNEILDQTDRFLQDIGVKVLVQKSDTRRIQERIADQEGDLAPPPTLIEAQEQPSSSADVTGVMDYYSSVHKVREEVQQPTTLVGGSLMPYQLAGLQWLVSLYNNKLHGILADEMGLGKTVQTIALFSYLAEYKASKGPHLVVVPLSTMPNWQSEFERWLPSFNIIAFRGSKDQRREALRQMRGDNVNVVLTTYDFILREKGPLTRMNWKYIVVDEGHRMKNSKSRLHQVLNAFTCANRLLLTGTPLQNNLTELWSLLNFLLPKIFQSADDFENWFNEPFSRMDEADGGDRQKLSEEEQMLIIHRLHIVLRPFLLRREKTEVLKDLPDKQEFVVRVELSEWQKLAYEQMSQNALHVVDTEGKVTAKSMHNSLMQMRKICNHPYLFMDSYRQDRDMYRVSGKFEVLDRMLPKLVHFGHKVLIFSQMTQLMDILGDYFEWRGLKYFRLDGSTAIEERRERMHLFNTGNEVNIFMLSTRAGGLGLNLQTADTVIIFDSDFNPQMDLQAQDRAHRVGQKNQVRVFRLITESQIEQSILDKAHHKLDIDQKIIQAGMFNRSSSEEDRRERLKSVMGGNSRSSWEGGPTAPEQLNRMMARSTEEFHYFQQVDAAALGAVHRKHSEEESILVEAGRLMSKREVPDWVTSIKLEGDDEEPVELTRDMRRSAGGTGNMISIDNLTDHQWLKLMEAQEAGLEYTLPHPKKRRRSDGQPTNE